jgi:hypothetical protein
MRRALPSPLPYIYIAWCLINNLDIFTYPFIINIIIIINIINIIRWSIFAHNIH